MGTDSFRAFIAVPLESAIRSRIGRLVDRLEPLWPRVKWVAERNLHVTLTFLGETPGERIPEVARAMTDAVGEMPMFSMTVAGLGAFPDVDHPTTLWVGCTAGSEDLIALHTRLESGLAEIGFRPEGRAYRPHVTMGRVDRPRGRYDRTTPSAFAEAYQKQRDWSAGEIEIDHLELYQSELSPKGPIYTSLARVPLGG